MSSRGLLVIGAVWFIAAAVLTIYLGQTDFAITWITPTRASRVGSSAVIYLMFISTALLLIGWIVPLGVGIYRLLKH